jgi:nitrite reductase/ring-hydroxylating ferredoxin subunit
MSWVALGLSADLEPGTSTGAIIEGREYVVWRDSVGAAHVWDDRCPHRGMRLSFGFVRGDRIACLYHGWQYDTSGQCRAVPAHPDLDVPATIRVATYPTIELAGLIWACFSADEMAPPDIDAGEVMPVRSVTIDRPIDVVASALAVGRLPGFAGSPTPTAFTKVGRKAWIVACGEDRLLIAGQVIDTTRSALHVVILGSPAIYAGAGQVHFARWAEAFRDNIEREEATA